MPLYCNYRLSTDSVIPIFLHFLIFFQNFPIFLIPPIFPIFFFNLDIFPIFFSKNATIPPVLICRTLMSFTACRYFYLQFTAVFFFFFFFFFFLFVCFVFCHLKRLYPAEVCYKLWLINVGNLMMNVPNFKS